MPLLKCGKKDIKTKTVSSDKSWGLIKYFDLGVVDRLSCTHQGQHLVTDLRKYIYILSRAYILGGIHTSENTTVVELPLGLQPCTAL